MTVKHKKLTPQQKAAAKKNAARAKDSAKSILPRSSKPPGSVKRALVAVKETGSPDQSDALDKALASLGKSKVDRAPTGTDKPVLADGALVVLRMSGGFAFSSREVVVFADGRVSSRHVEHGRFEQPATETKPGAKALASIKSSLTKANFSAQMKPAPQQRPGDVPLRRR